MRIAITGASGQLGRELCRQFGAAALPLTRADLDLSRPEDVRRAIVAWRPTLVINCAACTQVDQAQREPDLCRAVNALSVAELAAGCRELGCPLVQVSTDYVFGDPGLRVPWTEDAPTSPQGVYARTKWEGEQAAAQCERYWIVRTCGLYADPSHAEAKNFVKTMLRLGAAGQPLRIVADQFCTPTFVPDLARAIRFLAGVAGDAERVSTPIASGIYHVVNTGSTTWHDFALEVFRQAGLKVAVTAISSVEYQAPAPRPAYSVLDTTRYHALGGPAMPTWREALAEYFRRRAAEKPPSV